MSLRISIDRSAVSLSPAGDGDSTPPDVPLTVTARDREALPTARRLSRALLLKALSDLAPRWQPWRMNAPERIAWYKIGEESFDAVCTNSKEWLLVGRKYENKKQFEEAAQAYSRAIRLNPHCPSYYFRLGCTQCELGEWSHRKKNKTKQNRVWTYVNDIAMRICVG